MTVLSKKLMIITFAALMQPPAMAQSGHTMNSVDTTPGTTAPIAPTDRPEHPGTLNGSAVKLPGSRPDSELDKDAGSSKADRKASRNVKKLPSQINPDAE